MRDGVVSVAEAGAHPSVSLLRALKREFGFYCIDISLDEPEELEKPEIAFMMGGVGRLDELSTMERYDATSGQQRVGAVMAIGRHCFGVCVLAGDIYVTGGIDEDDDESLSSVEMYSLSSSTWSAGVPMLEARSEHAAVAMGSILFVLGGVYIGQDGQGFREERFTSSVHKYDSTQDTWSEVAPMPEPRLELAACAIGSDLYVFGGFRTRNNPQASVFKYDTEGNTWSTLAPMPHRLFSHSATVIDGLIYIVGAEDMDDYGRDFLRFDPASGAWTILAPTLYGRRYGVSFVLNKKLCGAGGSPGGDYDEGTTVECYDVATNTWAFVAGMLEGRRHFGVATIKSVGPIEIFLTHSSPRPLMILEFTQELIGLRSWKERLDIHSKRRVL
jgi:hypothetical protein